MSDENSAQKAEEIIFYLDLSSNFLKKKNVLKGIKEFIEEKNKYKISSPSKYGVVLFQADDNPINVYGKDTAEPLLEIVENSWDSREKERSYLENGLFEIFSYIFWKSRTLKKYFRVIIITDKPSELPESYFNVVYALIVKAKKFSTFINIIRVGKEAEYSDTVKLKIISSETQGGVFYCSDDKHFLSVLTSLVKNKEEFNIIKEEIPVLPRDQTFFEHLAVDLISLDSDDEEICSICNQETCPICDANTDEVNKCFNCNTKFHGCCASKYSLTNNIGFKHIFRCPQCSQLLKLDEEFVDMVVSEESGEEDFYTVAEDGTKEEILDEILQEVPEPVAKVEVEDTEALEKPPEGVKVEVKDTEAPEKPSEEVTPEKPPEKPPEPETKKVRVGGFFGGEVEIKATSADGDKAGPAPVKVVDSTVVTEPKKSITELRPPRRRKAIKLCKICGATVSTATCPSCGAPVD